MEPRWNITMDSTARAASALESMKSSGNTSKSAMTKSNYCILSQSNFRRQDREEMWQTKLVKAPSKSYRTSKPVRSMFLFELYCILNNPTYSKVITWSNDGGFFYVLDCMSFEELVMPHHFTEILPRYEEFLQQLIALGFTKFYNKNETLLPCYRKKSFSRSNFISMKQEEDVYHIGRCATFSLLPKHRAYKRVGRKPCLYSQDEDGRLSLKQKYLEKQSVRQSNYIMPESKEELFRSCRSLKFKAYRNTLELKRHILKCRRDHKKIFHIASSFLLHSLVKKKRKRNALFLKQYDIHQHDS
ncbi:hypothetical protein CTEN210_02030 [Chaetoceros tenuissimus]|uniref:HSF-type DNA-binding domain-containing protein n=1 Tax=Chaetoceros tenuissimus TaxID=426638 RepID=A0AAD3H098_9STRA|nr:hypothetical protein CTEN210_02030 [Chaetoceros tenuissimus]